MANITVSSTELKDTAAKLNAGSAEVQSTLDSMRARVDTLVSNQWTGAASESFTDLYSKWQESANALREALDGIGTMVGKSAHAYEETESTLANTFKQ